MAANTRTKVQREADLEKLAELYLQRHTQAEIAEILGVSQPQISLDLKKLQKRWADSALRSFDQAKAEELARIDELERVYFDAWRRSQGVIEIKSVDRERVVFDAENKMHKGSESLGIPLVDQDGVTVGKEGEIVRTSVRTENRVGEKAFLSGVEWCIQQRVKIFGIQAPARTKNEIILPKQYIGLDQLVELAKDWTDDETGEDGDAESANV